MIYAFSSALMLLRFSLHRPGCRHRSRSSGRQPGAWFLRRERSTWAVKHMAFSRFTFKATWRSVSDITVHKDVSVNGQQVERTVEKDLRSQGHFDRWMGSLSIPKTVRSEARKIHDCQGRFPSSLVYIGAKILGLKDLRGPACLFFSVL